MWYLEPQLQRLCFMTNPHFIYTLCETVSLRNFKISELAFGEDVNEKIVGKYNYDIKIHNVKSKKEHISTVVDLNYIHLNPKAEREQSILKNID